MTDEIGELCACVTNFRAKRMLFTVLCGVQPADRRAVLACCQRMEHRQHRRLTHACGNQRDWRDRIDLKEEVAVRCGEHQFITHLAILMQPAGDGALRFAFHRDAIRFAIAEMRQRVLTNLVMFEAGRLQVDCQILTGLKGGDRAAIYRRKGKAFNHIALLRNCADAKRPGAAPAAGLLLRGLINFLFAIDEYARQYAVGFAPCRQRLFAWIQQLFNGCQQIFTDDGVLRRLDIQAGMFLRNLFHRRQQRRQILQIRAIGTDGVEQRFTLIAVALVVHVEDVFEFRMLRQHAVIEVGRKLWAAGSDGRQGRFNGSDGVGIKHGISLSDKHVF